MGAGDREFKSLYPDTRETKVLCIEAPSLDGASYLSYIINQIQINLIKGHVFEGHDLHPLAFFCGIVGRFDYGWSDIWRTTKQEYESYKGEKYKTRTHCAEYFIQSWV